MTRSMNIIHIKLNKQCRWSMIAIKRSNTHERSRSRVPEKLSNRCRNRLSLSPPLPQHPNFVFSLPFILFVFSPFFHPVSPHFSFYLPYVYIFSSHSCIIFSFIPITLFLQILFNFDMNEFTFIEKFKNDIFHCKQCYKK